MSSGSDKSDDERDVRRDNTGDDDGDDGGDDDKYVLGLSTLHYVCQCCLSISVDAIVDKSHSVRHLEDISQTNRRTCFTMNT